MVITPETQLFSWNDANMANCLAALNNLPAQTGVLDSAKPGALFPINSFSQGALAFSGRVINCQDFAQTTGRFIITPVNLGPFQDSMIYDALGFPLNQGSRKWPGYQGRETDTMVVSGSLCAVPKLIEIAGRLPSTQGAEVLRQAWGSVSAIKEFLLRMSEGLIDEATQGNFLYMADAAVCRTDRSIGHFLGRQKFLTLPNLQYATHFSLLMKVSS